MGACFPIGCAGNGAIATFVYANWIAAYPEFTAVSEPAAQGYFDIATIYLRNDGTGPLPESRVSLQTTLLYMLTSHIAWLYSPQLNGVPDSTGPSPAPALVGRISQASEGSVSVTADWPNATAQSAWFLQTKYGAAFWQATAAWRTMRYVPAPQRTFNPPFGGPWSTPFGYLKQ